MIQLIKITPQYPNQVVNFFANQQSFTFKLRFVGYTQLADEAQQFINIYATPKFYADIISNDKPIITGAPVVNNAVINQYPSAMIGYIVCVNLINTDDNPNLDNLGNGVYFYYIDDISEIDNILNGAQ
jgi:hypothetical protein